MIDRLMPEVDRADGDDADQDRARDHPARVPHLVADVGHVVVAQVVVDADPRRRAEAEEEARRRTRSAPGGHVERDAPGRSASRRSTITAAVVSSVPIQRLTVSLPIESMRRYSSAMLTSADDDRDGDGAALRQRRPDVAEVPREADVAGGNLQRPAQDELPDEEERNQATPALPAEALAQVAVRPARPGHRRAQLAPDQAVGDHDDRAPRTSRGAPAARRAPTSGAGS